ncbi:transposase [Streptomyces sp. NPDC058611]|uniref:transposase n=1 Tax=unclassified Streptomyces TaxID=2593676 RepID=UPI00365CF059
MMENMPKKRPRLRRQFTPDFKAEIVDLCLRGDRSVPEIVKDFDLTETAVRLWLAQADESHQPKDLSEERAGRTRRAEAGKPPPAGGHRDPQAGHGFLGEGDPVTVDPFIEVEKHAGHSVKRPCDLLKVSRSAYYQ